MGKLLVVLLLIISDASLFADDVVIKGGEFGLDTSTDFSSLWVGGVVYIPSLFPHDTSENKDILAFETHKDTSFVREKHITKMRGRKNE